LGSISVGTKNFQYIPSETPKGTRTTGRLPRSGLLPRMRPLRFPRMRSRRGLRSLIGCFAAYTIALQVAMSGFLVVSCLASGAVASSEICAEHGSAGGDSSGQSRYLICPCGPACVMSACAAVVGTPVISARILQPTNDIASPLPGFGFERVSPTPASKGPHCPRAPPPPDALAI
jgi:hypothetical protein